MEIRVSQDWGTFLEGKDHSMLGSIGSHLHGNYHMGGVVKILLPFGYLTCHGLHYAIVWATYQIG